MGIFERIKNLWAWSEWSPGGKVKVEPFVDTQGNTYHQSSTKAEFIVPDRIGEIIKGKENPTIDDVLV